MPLGGRFIRHSWTCLIVSAKKTSPSLQYKSTVVQRLLLAVVMQLPWRTFLPERWDAPWSSRCQSIQLMGRNVIRNSEIRIYAAHFWLNKLSSFTCCSKYWFDSSAALSYASRSLSTDTFNLLLRYLRFDSRKRRTLLPCTCQRPSNNLTRSWPQMTFSLSNSTDADSSSKTDLASSNHDQSSHQVSKSTSILYCASCTATTDLRPHVPCGCSCLPAPATGLSPACQVNCENFKNKNGWLQETVPVLRVLIICPLANKKRKRRREKNV